MYIVPMVIGCFLKTVGSL